VSSCLHLNTFLELHMPTFCTNYSLIYVITKRKGIIDNKERKGFMEKGKAEGKFSATKSTYHILEENARIALKNSNLNIQVRLHNLHQTVNQKRGVLRTDFIFLCALCTANVQNLVLLQ
jgi:hypothetical protein